MKPIKVEILTPEQYEARSGIEAPGVAACAWLTWADRSGGYEIGANGSLCATVGNETETFSPGGHEAAAAWLYPLLETDQVKS